MSKTLISFWDSTETPAEIYWKRRITAASKWKLLYVTTLREVLERGDAHFMAQGLT
jgi:hypothetical protein